MQRYYQVDLRDLWRGGRLTFRRLAVLVRHLPVDCSIRHAFGADTWTPEMVLLGDLFAALTRQAHPRAPKPGPDPTLDRRLLAQRQRQRRRQHARRQLHAHQ